MSTPRTDPGASEPGTPAASETSSVAGMVSPRTWWRGADRSRRIIAVVGTVLVLAGIAVSVWFGLSSTVDRANWRQVAFDVRDDRSVFVRFAVSKPPESTARCVVEAQEVGYGTVGRKVVEVPPASDREVVVETTVRTTSLAVIGQVTSCEVESPRGSPESDPHPAAKASTSAGYEQVSMGTYRDHAQAHAAVV